MIRILFFLMPFLAFSQIQGSISVGGDRFSGNNHVMIFDTRAEIKSDSTNFTWNILPSFRITHNDSLISRESYMVMGIEKRMGFWKVLAFSESENSFLRKINYRGSVGIGVSRILADTDRLKIHISEALLPEFFYSTKQLVSVRASTRLKILYESPRIRFSSVTLVQPAMVTKSRNYDVSSRNNFNMRSINFVEFPVKTDLSIGLGFDLVMQTLPSHINPSVRPADTRSYLLIKYTFK